VNTKDTVIAEGAKKLATDGAHISTKRLRRQRRINRVVLVVARFAAPCLVVTGLWFDWRFLVLAVALCWVSYSRSMLVAIAEIELQRIALRSAALLYCCEFVLSRSPGARHFTLNTAAIAALLVLGV